MLSKYVKSMQVNIFIENKIVLVLIINCDIG